MGNAQQKSTLALVKKDVVDVVAKRVESMVSGGELHLPDRYSAPNAIAAWWLLLQSTKDRRGRPVLEVCTKDSIANATLDMVVQGLNPAKKQCYPIAYGDQLVCQRSYFGDEALLRRARPDVAHVYVEAYYEGDQIHWQIVGGRRTVGSHVQAEENIGGLETLRGGYAVIVDKDGETIHCERMTIDQIKGSWKKSKTYGRDGTSFHDEQPEEAVKRTVLRRACKRLINSSDDQYLVGAVRRQEDAASEVEIEAEMAERANGEVIDITPEVASGEPEAGDAEPQEGALDDEEIADRKIQIGRTVADLVRLEQGLEPDADVKAEDAEAMFHTMAGVPSMKDLQADEIVELHEKVLARRRELMDAIDAPDTDASRETDGDPEPKQAELEGAAAKGPRF